jgi:acetoin utilization protein AcuC
MGVDTGLCVYLGEGLARYGFGGGHPFGPDRMYAFQAELERQGLERKVRVVEPVAADARAIGRFHDAAYVGRVMAQSKHGVGFLDYGDTPAFPGVYEAAAIVVGSGLDALRRIMERECRRAFVPIAGLHHARRDRAGGFCVFNDCGVLIETLRSDHDVRRIAYVDIDAHHGDGVYYEFEDDPELFIVDLHEDGRFLYPGTGRADESGRGPAAGTKLNIPMPPSSDDASFLEVWARVESFVSRAEPQFILLQCGADSITGDPITHLRYTPEAHAHAARRLRDIADRYAEGRLIALGGGGYNRANLAKAWTAVVAALV